MDPKMIKPNEGNDEKIKPENTSEVITEDGNNAEQIEYFTE